MASPRLVDSFRRARWPVIFGVWTLVGLCDIARGVIFLHWVRSLPPRVSWMAMALASNELWAVLTPLLFWLTFRYPILRATWRRHLPVHVLISLLMTVVDSTLLFGVESALGGDHSMSFGARYCSQLILDGFVYAAVASLAHAKRSHTLYLERVLRTSELEGQLARAQLQALEMQLHPHFLFNTLNSVASLVRIWRNDDAVRAIAALGDLLRATLERDGVPEVTLAEELRFTHRYLEIQRLRFDDRLRVVDAVDPELADALVPRLILQPLVENAIRHGVERSTEPVTIEISARGGGGRLLLAVRDSGEGPAGEGEGPGIGLRNTRARLQALYGEQQRFELRSTPGGTEARLEIPLRRGEVPAEVDCVPAPVRAAS
ncbi:MAG TPA: histidine kinase [Polyangia bacterium]|jgi:two-component sensor histidine kinase|nr:histidine kinase [Polyangia bacterium]